MRDIRFYYSPSTLGFYRSDVHGEGVPADCAEISEHDYVHLMRGQEKGLRIEPCSEHGARLCVHEPTHEDIARAVEAARQAAYKTESDPLFFKAQRGEIGLDQWLEKVAEIKARYPAGVMPATGA